MAQAGESSVHLLDIVGVQGEGPDFSMAERLVHVRAGRGQSGISYQDVNVDVRAV